MLTKNQLTTIIFTAVLFWGALLTAQGIAVSATWLKPLSSVVGALMVLLSVFNLWLWKLPIFRNWLVKRPVIAGTWRATIHSTWIDPSTGTPTGPITGYMVIRQTYSNLSMRLMTPESSSALLSADITKAEDGLFTVSGVYRNEPRIAVRDRSVMHHGAILLQVIGNPASALKGTYWTDRKSAGDIELTGRRSKTFDDYASAAN
jgi:hypothetical protein